MIIERGTERPGNWYERIQVPPETAKIQVWTNDGYDGTEIHIRFLDESGQEIKPA